MSAAPGAPPVLRSALVARPLDEAFAVFTRQIGAWWPLPTHGIFGAEAGALGFEEGHLVERAVDGRTSVWGEVLAWEPPHRIVLTWHPGQEADQASEVEVRFTASEGGGTRVELEHRGWERFGPDALRRRHGYVGPGAWGHVLDHFAGLADPRPDAVDLTAVGAAYEAFFAEAERGGFGEPSGGGVGRRPGAGARRPQRPRDDRGGPCPRARPHRPRLRQRHLPGPAGARRLGRHDG